MSELIDEICIVLGAGASVDCGFPLYADLTNADRLSQLLSHAHERDYIVKLCQEIIVNNMHFEQLLTYLAKEGDEEKIEKALIYYQKVLTIPDFYADEWNLSFLAGFLAQPFFLSADVPVHVISFNHDLLIEKCSLWQFEYGLSLIHI